MVKIVMGLLVVFVLVVLLVLDWFDMLYWLLGSFVMVILGCWFYGLFIWYLVVLVMVFFVIGVFLFIG